VSCIDVNKYVYTSILSHNGMTSVKSSGKVFCDHHGPC